MIYRARKMMQFMIFVNRCLVQNENNCIKFFPLWPKAPHPRLYKRSPEQAKENNFVKFRFAYLNVDLVRRFLN